MSRALGLFALPLAALALLLAVLVWFKPFELLNPDAPLSGVTLVLGAVEAGDYKAARKRLSALPRTGLDQTIVPLLEAWVLFANDELDSALDVL